MMQFFRRVRAALSRRTVYPDALYVGQYRGGGNDHEPSVQEVVDRSVKEGDVVTVYIAVGELP